MNSFASPPTLGALPFPRRADDLYSRVFDAILEQRIDVTSRFTEESLAQMFSARRSDIRGVLMQLSHQQVIVLRANHRPRVAALDCEQTRQMLHARRLTEITLVRLACQSRSQDLKPLRALIESERHCTAGGSAIRLSGEFHLRLAEMAGNAPLAHFLGSLVPLTSLAIAQFGVHLEGYCVWHQHQAILEAVERGNAVKAEDLLGQHLDYLEGILLNSESSISRNRVAG
ncbi:GntR family transcriptional regulator [Pseudomonas frederiksbergensis]|uniref:GntR family transcriptional regulator n=1 Tax=Pseudomonas frederiksbergensis TaxID=104087 RepID=UPI000F47148B|nr:GntR family transcriptional regulator [Pseudomonas frederiksbergensis]RON58106.1 GntR family transcriptional regulator [Pseudomonas frederiksbergensis]